MLTLLGMLVVVRWRGIVYMEHGKGLRRIQLMITDSYRCILHAPLVHRNIQTRTREARPSYVI